MTTVVHLTKLITMDGATAILDWLKANVEHEFTGEGMSEITFQNDEDATLFKIMFDV